MFFVGCSGGGGGSTPTEPSGPAFSPLQVSWEYKVFDEEAVRGTSFPIPGNTIVLLHRAGGTSQCCLDDGTAVPCLIITGDDGQVVEIIYWPQNVDFIVECRITAAGEVQAYFHDPLSHENPGTLGPFVASGCSRAEEWGSYVECCLAGP